MDITYFLIILAIYVAFVHFNYIYLCQLTKKEFDKVFSDRSLVFILSGPIFIIIAIAFFIKIKIKIMLRNRKIRKEGAESVLINAFCDKYNIKIDK